MFRSGLTSAVILFCVLLSGSAFAEPEIGSEDWHFNVSKAIAVELADTPAWSIAAAYLREISPKSQDWNLLLLKEKVELQYGNIPEAEKVIQRALEMNDQNPRILTMAGNIASDAGKLDDAVYYYEKAIEKQPKNTQVLLSLGRIRSARREWSQTIEVYEKLLTLMSPTSEICVRLATAYENTGELNKAESNLIANLELHPNRVLALMPLERFYRKYQKTERADEIAKEREKLQKKEGDQRVLRDLQKSSR